MNIINRIRGKSSGFTLIELLVVIAIIGILAAVVLVSLNSARQKARDAKRLADVRQIMTALELYYNDNNAYPAVASGQPDQTACTTTQYKCYMSLYPTYPTPTNDGTCGAGLSYTYGGGGSDYTVAFCLGAATGGLSAGSHTATRAGLQ